jgi:hypothetical protein
MGQALGNDAADVSRLASRVRERRATQIIGYSRVNALTRFFTSMAGLSPSEWQSRELAGEGLSLAFTPMRMTAPLARPTPQAEDRFLALSARSSADPEGQQRVDCVEKLAK